MLQVVVNLYGRILPGTLDVLEPRGEFAGNDWPDEIDFKVGKCRFQIVLRIWCLNHRGFSCGDAEPGGVGCHGCSLRNWSSARCAHPLWRQTLCHWGG